MKASNYGELASWYIKKPLVAYVEFGSYQGEYIVVLDNGDDLDFYKGYYGSCSGCDWLEAVTDWEDNEIDDKEALKFSEKEFNHPFISMPKETVLRVDSDTFTAFLPKNVRGDIWDFDGAELHKEIVSKLKTT